MNIKSRIPRSIAIARNWQTFSPSSLFSAFIYPVLGIALLASIISVGYALKSLTLHWWYFPIGVAVMFAAIIICNSGIGVLHRIMQHRAGDIKWPAQIFTMLNLMIAMQGSVREWVNYHSQHHRFSDKAGDPHNPFESKSWAWVGWILFRDKNDVQRPMAMWLKENAVIVWMDRFYNEISLGIHLFIPAIIYGIVLFSGGSMVLTAMLHAFFVIGRAIQFHATVYGINVLGHLKTPKWVDYIVAFLTGGEAFHDHHHDEPQSALHLPRRGFFNRVFDYNGTILLVMEKLGMARNLKIAAQFE